MILSFIQNPGMQILMTKIKQKSIQEPVLLLSSDENKKIPTNKNNNKNKKNVNSFS